MENKRIRIGLPEKLIQITFKNAIQEVESLQEFCRSFYDTWSKNQISFKEKYASGLKINEIIENLLDSEDPENDYTHVKESTVGENLFKDIIDLRITKNDESTRISYSMNKKFRDQDPKQAHIKQKKLIQQKEIFIRSVLSNIIIIFERYFAQIYEFMVVLNPERYFEGKCIKINELFCSSFKQIIINEVHKQVSGNMYDSLATLNTMKEKSGFNIDRYIPIRKDFEEIYYRRNVFVHNSGTVNETYLDKVSEKYTAEVKNGSKLICDETYVENAIIILKKIICVLLYEFLFTTKGKNDSYEILADTAFSALCNEEYVFCEYIYDILKRHKGFEFLDKTMYEVNYMIAMKQQQKPISANLKKFDTSAMQDQFVIAKYCLKDDNESVYKLLSKVYPDEVPTEAIRDWPLFIDFRRSKEYDKFVSEHKSDFDQYEFETSDTPKSDERSDVICDEVTTDE